MNFLRLMWVSIAYAIMQFGITAIVYFNPLIVGKPQPLYGNMSPTLISLSPIHVTSCLITVERRAQLTVHDRPGWSALQCTCVCGP